MREQPAGRTAAEHVVRDLHDVVVGAGARRCPACRSHRLLCTELGRAMNVTFAVPAAPGSATAGAGVPAFFHAARRLVDDLARVGHRQVARDGEHGVIGHVMRLVEAHQRLARDAGEILFGHRHPRRRMAAVENPGHHLRREKAGAGPLRDQARTRARLVAIELFLRERGVEQDVRRQRKRLGEILGQARAGDGRRDAGERRADADRGGLGLEQLGDLQRRARGRALAHHDGGDLRQTHVACGIEIAARARNQELERHLRDAPILEHHQVQPVRQIDFRGPRQLDLQDLGRDGRAALEDDGLGAPAPAGRGP